MNHGVRNTVYMKLSMAFSHQHAILHQAWVYALIRIHALLFLFKPECIPKF